MDDNLNNLIYIESIMKIISGLEAENELLKNEIKKQKKINRILFLLILITLLALLKLIIGVILL